MPSRPFWRSFTLDAHGLCSALALCFVASAPNAHAQKSPGAIEAPDSRLDVYAGYSYLHPWDSGVNGYQYQPISHPSVTASVTGWFGRYLGAQVEGAYFSGGGEHSGYVPNCPKTTCDQLLYTAEAGPAFRLPLGRLVPFAHALAGGERSNGPAAQNLQWGWGVTSGLGVDYVLPFFDNLFAVRPIQADYHYGHVDHGAVNGPNNVLGGVATMDAVKLSGGLVVRIGDKTEAQPVMLGCTAEPVSVHPGDTVKITGSTLYLNPKRLARYSWNSNGGTVNAQGPEATVDTTGLAPGEYTVEGHVSEGPRAREQASCTAPFTVRPIEPPTVTCIAAPLTAPSGTTIDILTTAISPQDRPLTYSYTASAGQILSTGPTAKLTTAGLGSMTVTVLCNAVDDLGQSAQSTAKITLEKPAPPQVPETQTLCTINFTRDHRRPVRVDNESKACLDDIALTMTQQTSARLVIIGNASPDEKPEAAAQRALNERQYLTGEKGLDRSRIEVRVGDTSGRTVRNVLVPTGAAFSDANTQTFDESIITRSGQAYGTGHGKNKPAPKHRRRSSTAAPLPPAPEL